MHVGFVQLQGEKEFVLLPPSDAPYLYTIPGREFPFQLRNSRVRYADIENHERFPLLKSASPRRVVLRAGQALFLPADWWHTTRNISDSVSYSVRIVNGSNADPVPAPAHRGHSPLAAPVTHETTRTRSTSM